MSSDDFECHAKLHTLEFDANDWLQMLNASSKYYAVRRIKSMENIKSECIS